MNAPFKTTHSHLYDFHRGIDSSRKKHICIVKFPETEIKIKIVKLSFFDQAFKNTSREGNIIKVPCKKIEEDEKCLQLLKNYLTKGIIEELVDRQTIKNLRTLAKACGLSELLLSCDCFLNENIRNSIGEVVQSLNDPFEQDNEFLPCESITQLLSEKASSPHFLAFNLINYFDDKNTPITEQIERFKKEHPKKIQEVQKLGWNGLKENYKTEMENPNSDPDKKGISFSAFRDLINDLVKNLVNEAAKSLSMGEIKTQIFGTPGYKSDKDITMTSAGKEILTTGEMVILKAIAELMTVSIVGEFPGIALDTEWYIDRKFLGDLVTSKEAKAKLLTLDLTMAIVHAKELFKDDIEKYNEYKRNQLEGSIDSVKEIKEKIFEQVERWHEKMASEVSIQLLLQRENSSEEKNLYNAKVLSQIPKLLSLGKKCGQLELEIEKTQLQIEEEKSKHKNVNNLIAVLDNLIVNHDILYSIINSRQPECTMASSELKVTLDSQFGQKSIREIEKKEQALEEQINQIELTSPRKTRRLIKEQKQLKAFKEITNLPIEVKSVDYRDLSLAGHERFAQFSSTIQENDDPVNAGKYFLRAIEAIYKAVDLLKKEEDLESEILRGIMNDLLERGKRFYLIASHFEQAKRGFKLNAIAFKKNLSKLLLDKGDLKSDLDELSNKGELGGTWDGQIMTLPIKMFEMTQFLKLKKYIDKKEQNLICRLNFIESSEEIKPERFLVLSKIQKILLARAGFKSSELNFLHEKSKKTTLKYYNLDIQNNIKILLTEFEKFFLECQTYTSKLGDLTFSSALLQEDLFKPWNKEN